MTQGFDEWYKETGSLLPRRAYMAGVASRQAEIDELKSVITKQQIQMLQIQQSCSGCDSRDLLIGELQKRIDSIREIMSAGVYHIPTLIRDLNNALKGDSNE